MPIKPFEILLNAVHTEYTNTACRMPIDVIAQQHTLHYICRWNQNIAITLVTTQCTLSLVTNTVPTARQQFGQATWNLNSRTCRRRKSEYNRVPPSLWLLYSRRPDSRTVQLYLLIRSEMVESSLISFDFIRSEMSSISSHIVLVSSVWC